MEERSAASLSGLTMLADLVPFFALTWAEPGQDDEIMGGALVLRLELEGYSLRDVA